jgi:hypothetical protein
LSPIFSIVPLILLAALIASLVEEGIVFALGYWLISWVLFSGGLIGGGEFTFNIFFPLWMLFTAFYAREVDFDESGIKVYLIISAIIVIAGLVVFFSIERTAPTQIPGITITTGSTISTTTSTGTSTSTSTVPPYTGCPTEPPTGNFIPLKCCGLKPMPHALVEFNFTLNENASPIYNVYLACTTQPLNPTAKQFYALLPNGVPDLSRSLNGTSLYPGRPIQVKYWPCDSNSTVGPFVGYLWVNFTRYSGLVTSLNPWERYRTFDLYINDVLQSSVYNQTINTTC